MQYVNQKVDQALLGVFKASFASGDYLGAKDDTKLESQVQIRLYTQQDLKKKYLTLALEPQLSLQVARSVSPSQGPTGQLLVQALLSWAGLHKRLADYLKVRMI